MVDGGFLGSHYLPCCDETEEQSPQQEEGVHVRYNCERKSGISQTTTFHPTAITLNKAKGSVYSIERWRKKPSRLRLRSGSVVNPHFFLFPFSTALKTSYLWATRKNHQRRSILVCFFSPLGFSGPGLSRSPSSCEVLHGDGG